MKFGKELSLRALFLGALLSVCVAAYSAFAGLKIGGVYWPIVTTSLVSLALLKVLGGTSSKEIAVMQTAGSSGGLLAAGVIFTIPAAWMLGLSVTVYDIILISLTGGILGVMFSYPLRKQLVEREALPCADGTAAASLIKAGDSKGEKAKALFYAFSAGAAFSVLRDWFKAIPGFVNLDTLKVNAGNFSLGSAISLIPLAGGFLIGPRFTLAWFLGAAATFFALIPYALSTGLYSAKGQVLAEIARPLGVGIVLGAAIAYFALKGIPAMGRVVQDYKNAKWGKHAGLLLIVSVGVLTVVSQMDALVSAIAIIGAFAMAYVAARITGEMNVDPMEIFAMLIMLFAKLFLGTAAFPLVVIAAVVTIAAGMAGDMMQDLKAGHLLGVKPESQMVAQTVGLVAASLVIGAIVISINGAYGIGGVDFPAPQAVAVKEVVQSAGLSQVMIAGILLGALATIASSKIGWGIVPVAFGIGLYVPIELSFPLFIGGLVRYASDKAGKTESRRIAAAGLIAGEGLVGVVLSLAGFAAIL
ncbi:MAG: OPT/YSL family transporter [Candidatus Norongarragalinales archaeon]